jgi:hypothetical protein
VEAEAKAKADAEGGGKDGDLLDLLDEAMARNT